MGAYEGWLSEKWVLYYYIVISWYIRVIYNQENDR